MFRVRCGDRVGPAGALVFLGWRRLAPHFRENRDASQALIDHVIYPLLGKKPE